MSVQSWPDALEHVLKYMVRIETPSGHGSGFLVAKRIAKKGDEEVQQSVVATAYHVIRKAVEAGQPLALELLTSDKTFQEKAADLQILVEPERDLALIHCDASCLPFPGELPNLAKPNVRLKPGSEIAWCGFPHVETVGSKTPCFFSGHVSAVWTEHADYLVDGVAIHGVSGGPVFDRSSGDVVIVGVVTSYIPNLAVKGAALPGVCLARTIGDIVAVFEGPVAQG